MTLAELLRRLKSPESPRSLGVVTIGKRRHQHPFENFLHLEHYRAVYANNPKSACTTIKSLLLADQDLPPDHDVHQWAFRKLALSRVEEERARAILRDSMVFTFVRHPLSRVVSAYRDKVKQFHWRMTRGAPPRRGRRATFPCAQQRYRQITRTLGLERSAFVSLDAFLDYLEIVFRRKYRDRLQEAVDAHFDLQCSNLSIREVDFDFVGRVESIAADLDQLGTLLGVQFEAPERLNKSQGKADPSPEQVRRIEALYKEDYELLGY